MKIANCLTENQIVHKIDDTSGAIGKRYWRSDEFGIPFAITLDYKTFEDFSVTLRDRDSMEQIRIKVNFILFEPFFF
jgi:glycyl-tRNA synthetase